MLNDYINYDFIHSYNKIKNKNKNKYLHQYDVICISYIATSIVTKQKYLNVNTMYPKSLANV